MSNLSAALTEDKFWLIGQGHVSFQLLWSALELGFFDVLEAKPGIDRTSLAKELSIEEYPCRVLTMGLTSLGLIQQQNENYSNSNFASTNLMKNGHYHKILGWQRHIVYPGLIKLTDSLKASSNKGLSEFPGNGPTLYDRLTSHPDLEEIFQNAMMALSTIAKNGLVSLSLWPGQNHVIDLGGGKGTNSIAIAQSFKNLKLTILDNASVLKRTQLRLKEENLSERIECLPGDIFTSAVPETIDTCLFCHMLTIFSPEQNKAIFRRYLELLPTGGKFVVYNMFTRLDETGPIASALGIPYFLAIASGKGFIYSVEEATVWLKEAGFGKVSVSPEQALHHRAVIGEKT